MTIVGIEQKMDGSKTLLVFDPMYHDASNVMRLVGQTFTHRAPDAVLMAYRRDTKYLSKYNEFEFLK
jgi:zinc finger-containing ubiquitin peptidase 1